jgi:hypothetical protein
MEKNQSSQNSEFKWGERVLFGVSVTSIFTALFGFGVASGFADVFGFDPTMLFESTFDLLVLSWRGYAQMFIKLPNPDDLYWILFKSNSTLYIPIAIALAICWSGYVLMKNERVFSYFEKYKAFNNKVDEKKQKMFELSAILLLTPIATSLAMVVALFFVVLFFMTPFFIGLVSARSFANEQIISPKHCAVVQSRADYMESIKQLKTKSKNSDDQSAQCISVKSTHKESNFESSGRLVNGTSHYVIIYHAPTGITERIPLQGMVVSPSNMDI